MFRLQDSAENWYREIYLPFAEAVRERGMMRWFPDRTITDLYVWMAEHREELEKELGWTIRPEAAAGGGDPDEEPPRHRGRVKDRELAQGTPAQPLFRTSLPRYPRADRQNPGKLGCS